MAAHRYWRINILTTAQGYVGMYEMELRDTPGGADRTTPGGTITAQSSVGGWAPSQLIDNNNALGWASSNPAPQWVVFDFGAGNSFDIVELYILPRSDSSLWTQAPSSFDWQWSDDGNNWFTATTKTGITWSSAAAQTFNVAAPTPVLGPHRYWRIYITATNASYCGFAEIELRDSPGGADRTGSGTATASASEGSSLPPGAVDNNTSTKWASYPGGPPQWWAYDFGAGNSFYIVELFIVPRQDGFSSEAPKDFYWQYSDDGTTWITVYSKTGLSLPLAGATVPVAYANTTLVTQEVVEVVLEPTATPARISQEVVEVVMDRSGPAFVSQEVIEVIINTSQAENPSNAVAMYSKAGLLVREAGRGGALGGLIAYAPRIAFHWQGIGAAQLGMDGSGVVRTMTQDGLDYTPFAAKLIESKNGGFKFPDATVQATAASQTPWAQNVDAAGYQLLNVGTLLYRKEGFGLQELWRVNGGADGFAIQRDAVLNQHTNVTHYGTGNLIFNAPTGSVKWQANGSVQAETQSDGFIKLGTGLRFPDLSEQTTAAVAALSYADPGRSGEDVILPHRPVIHFSGAGVIASDNVTDNRTEIMIPGGSSVPADTVTSVFGRPGPAITAQAGDYTAALVTNAVSDLGSYSDPVWITALAWGKLTGVPATFAPSAHTHTWSDITNPPATYAPSAHTHAWAEITAKPAWNSAHSEAINLAWYLCWKNFGAGHIIFDASQATTPPQSANGLSRACDSGTSEVAWAASYPTLMGWNGTSTYGLRVDVCRRADSAASADAASSVAWGNVSGKPSIVYNDGGTYSINVTGNSGNSSALSGIGLAQDTVYPANNSVCRNSSNGWTYVNNLQAGGNVQAGGQMWCTHVHTTADVQGTGIPPYLAGQNGDSFLRWWTAPDIIVNNRTGDTYLSKVLLKPVGGEGGEMQWLDASSNVFMVADVDNQPNPAFRLWRGASIIYLSFTPSTNTTQLRIAGVTYTLTVDTVNKIVKVL